VLEDFTSVPEMTPMKEMIGKVREVPMDWVQQLAEAAQMSR